MKAKPYSRVYLEITNICNRSCSFCHGTARSPATMDRAHFATALNKLLPYTDYLYFHLMGEPLMHPNLSEYLRMAAEMGFKCAITTNGTLLDKRGEDIIRSGAYKVNVSLHSFENGEDRAHSSYVNSICDFADRASREGVLTVLRLWNRGGTDQKNDDTLQILKSRLAGEWVWGSRGARIRDKLHLEYGDRFEWPDVNASRGDGRVFCYGLSDHFGVLVDGTVVPCCLDSEGTIALGNIFETELSDILLSERSKRISEGFAGRKAVEQLCNRCGYARRFKV